MGRLIYIFRLWIAFAFVLGGLVGASLWASYDGSINPENQTVKQNACQECKGQDENKSFWQKATGDPVAVGTFLLVLVTGMMWGATYGLLRETKTLAEGAKDQAADMKKSIAEATRSAIFPENITGQVMIGGTHALFVWGTVTYEDIFGYRRRTTFAHQHYWIGIGESQRVAGFYLQRHNKGN